MESGAQGQWRRSAVKYWGQGQSRQAIKLFQALQKIIFTFHFWLKSLILDIGRVIQQQFFKS